MADVPLMFRQGDVLITRIDSIPSGAEIEGPDPREPGKVILAWGEVTGHHHRFRAGPNRNPRVRAFRVAKADGVFDRYVEVRARSVLRHEEHSEISVPAGTYKLTIQREYAGPDSERFVAD